MSEGGRADGNARTRRRNVDEEERVEGREAMERERARRTNGNQPNEVEPRNPMLSAAASVQYFYSNVGLPFEEVTQQFGVQLRKYCTEETFDQARLMLISGKENTTMITNQNERNPVFGNDQVDCIVTSLSSFERKVSHFSKIDTGTTLSHGRAFVASGARLVSEPQYAYSWARQQTFLDGHGLPPNIINECVAGGLFIQGDQLKCFKCGGTVPLSEHPIEEHNRLYAYCLS